MQCFSHQDKQAICICNVCSKGLCKECVYSIENKGRPICSNTCKKSLQQTLDLNTYAAKLYGITKKAGPKKMGIRLGMLDILIGIVFAVMGMYFLMQLNLTEVALFSILCGFIFIMRGLSFIKKI